jgi:hypothetical protein
LGVLFLLDNLNITSIDWGSLWKLWPIIIIALGLEVLLGRRVSFGSVLLVVIIIIIAGAAVWWSVVIGTGDQTIEHFTWPLNGAERAEVELDIGVGELQLGGYSDMADLIVADLELAPGAKVSHDAQINEDVARGWIISERDFFSVPSFFGNKGSKWDPLLNSWVR